MEDYVELTEELFARLFNSLFKEINAEKNNLQQCDKEREEYDKTIAECLNAIDNFNARLKKLKNKRSIIKGKIRNIKSNITQEKHSLQRNQKYMGKISKLTGDLSKKFASSKESKISVYKYTLGEDDKSLELETLTAELYAYLSENLSLKSVDAKGRQKEILENIRKFAISLDEKTQSLTECDTMIDSTKKSIDGKRAEISDAQDSLSKIEDRKVASQQRIEKGATLIRKLVRHYATGEKIIASTYTIK